MLKKKKNNNTVVPIRYHFGTILNSNRLIKTISFFMQIKWLGWCDKFGNCQTNNDISKICIESDTRVERALPLLLPKFSFGIGFGNSSGLALTMWSCCFNYSLMYWFNDFILILVTIRSLRVFRWNKTTIGWILGVKINCFDYLRLIVETIKGIQNLLVYICNGDWGCRFTC